ncbi:MAG: hypothetical protein JNL11_15115 [Bdellovibrionaceae bacterium]|nr:hypothetical protein [Pseudobdellovibrionaceae bacterium]
MHAKNATPLAQKLALYGIECEPDGFSCWLNRSIDCVSKKDLERFQLPSCGGNSSGIKLMPSSLPLAGVFIGCRAYRDGCLNSVKSIVRETPDVKINLVVDDGGMTEQFVDQVMALGGNVNLIPAKRKNKISSSDAPTFARDLGVFGSESGVPTFIHMPYINSQLDSSNTTLFKYISKVCQFSPSQHSYISKTDFQSLVHKAEKTLDAYGTPAELRAEFDAIWSEKENNTTSETYSMGGNFLPLPFDLLVVGRSNSDGASRGILNYFNQFQTVLELNLPAHFGHIDEIFNVVPNDAPSASECSFTILQASPKLLLTFLKKASVSLHPSFYDLFTAQEDDIEMMNRTLIAWIKKARGNSSACTPKVVKLPASAGELLRWNKQLVSFNPINGLSAGTVYFYSKPRMSIETGSVLSQALEFKIAEQLEAISIKAVPTDTQSYDSFGGNLHCATNEVRWACQPPQ